MLPVTHRDLSWIPENSESGNEADPVHALNEEAYLRPAFVYSSLLPTRRLLRLSYLYERRGSSEGVAMSLRRSGLQKDVLSLYRRYVTSGRLYSRSVSDV